MRARRLLLAVLVCVCSLGVALWAGAGSAGAATRFGERGEKEGQLNGPFGVAVSQASGGDVYVSEFNGNRLDRFDQTGRFKLLWGWGVDEASRAEEVQTCMVECREGSNSFHPGADPFNPEGLAVDNEPGSPSYGDVYVYEALHRVSKYGPSGEFLLMFGGEVNETKDNAPGASEAEKDVCRAGEACKAGVSGSADGEFEGAYLASFVAVGPGGQVYVGDRARVQVFEASGAWRESISLAGLSSTGKVTALAVDWAGDVFVADSEAAGVREFEPGPLPGAWSEKAIAFDAASTSVTAVALDGSGHLYIADSSGGPHILKYDAATGEEQDSFASKTIPPSYSGIPAIAGMAFSQALGELFVSGFEEDDVWVFSPPPPGPLVEPGSERATPELRGATTLEATLDPEGSETTYHFEYVSQAQYEASGFAGASSTTPGTVGSSTDFEDHQLTVHLTGLVPGGTYHYRLVAANSQGSATGEDVAFTPTPPASIEGPWVANVSDTSATFAARIDPLGANTAYMLEYGPSASYGHTLAGSVGEGMGYVEVSFHRQDLQPATTYHYRVVTTSEVGTVEGADHTFTTQAAAGDELSLPDGRAWELVSPSDKHGALIPGISDYTLTQAAADGSGIFYTASEPVGEGARGRGLVSPTLSSRASGGWRAQDLTLPSQLPKEGTPASVDQESYKVNEYPLFSSDLSRAVAEQVGSIDAVPLSSEATERTLYLRDNANGVFLPLVTPADVPPGTKFGGERIYFPSGLGFSSTFMNFITATPDLKHVVLMTPLALTPEATTNIGEVAAGSAGAGRNQYEWGEGHLKLIDVLPDGKAMDTVGGKTALLGQAFAPSTPATAHAISNDGRWIVWDENGGESVYIRDMVGERTRRIGGSSVTFQMLSGDGSRVFFLERGELYELDPGSGATRDITAVHGAGESSAGVKNAVLGASEDGSYVYFVASGVLAEGASGGEDNLYVAHFDGSGWVTTFIATLAPTDEKSWSAPAPGHASVEILQQVSSRVSPNGRYVAFMSERSLTGYDNVDAVTGQRDEEVYLYDARSDRLACASCNPTGARPVGMLDTLDSQSSGPLVDRQGAWTSHVLAGSVPTWRKIEGEADYQPRYLSGSGRLFFESPDALVPQATNGVEDVYEYEPAGAGSCASSSVTYSVRSDGCVSLMSSGISGEESALLDASEMGGDAFFVTVDKLVPEDYDASYDVYDAHVCTALAPCRVAPVSPPACTSGDSCKAAPSPQPEIFGAPPSATFNGTGNLAAPESTLGSRSLQPVERLSRALRSCRKKHGRARRAVCERRARRRYGGRRSGDGKATRKGGR